MSTPAAEQLRKRGLRATAQRLAVLQAVPQGAHVTADSVAETVKHQGGSISVQGVYDALAALVRVGLVRRIQPAGSSALFEVRTGDNHHHVICRGCGEIADTDCAAGYAPCLEGDHSGYEIDEAEVTLWGRCPACQSKARDASTTLSTFMPSTTNPARQESDQRV